jgi:putative ABC transport system ATP-binding protein
LDAENGRRIWTLLRSLAHEVGHAVIVVTHDPRAVPYADRVVYLEDGRIVKRTVVVPAAGCRAKSRPEARRFR